MEYITDAHALLWHLYQPRRLGETAKQIFIDADAGQICVNIPAVVLAEVIMVVQKGRLPGASIKHLMPHIQSIKECENYRLLPLLPETVVSSNEYTIIPDIFDRLIVTEAILQNCPLVTYDQIIRQSQLVSTVW